MPLERLVTWARSTAPRLHKPLTGAPKAVRSWSTSVCVHVGVLALLALWSHGGGEPTRVPASLVAVILDSDVTPAGPLEPLRATVTAMAATTAIPGAFDAADQPAPAIAADDWSLPEANQLPAAALEPDVLLRAAPSSAARGLGGGFEGRRGGARQRLAMSGGGNAESEAAVERGLRWLALHQRADGSWHFDHDQGDCAGRCGNPGTLSECTTGATALALLPFLGAGCTHLEGTYAQRVDAGLRYLTGRMRPAAVGGSLVEGGGLYDHGIATIALCEAYGMTRDTWLMDPAQQAIDFIAFAQDPHGGGWRYAPRRPGDTSVVGWQLMALKSGQLAFLEIPSETIAGATAFLIGVQTDDGAAYGYMGPGNAPSTTAIGLLSRMYLGWDRRKAPLRRGVERLAELGPSPDDVYYNYYATQVLHHFGGKRWIDWNSRMRDYLIDTQARDGHASGTWFFEHAQSSHLGGRLYTTSLCLMTLEVYYRHMPLYAEASVAGDF